MTGQNQKPHLKTSKQAETTKSRKKKQKGKTQKTSMESVLLMGPTGKKKMIKRPW